MSKISYRTGQLGLKEFYSLLYEDKKKYINFLLELEETSRSELDMYILQNFSRTSNTGATVKFLQLEDN